MSDAEMRRVHEAILSTDGISILTTKRIADIFPYIDVNITGDVIYIGKPPWDMTQEIALNFNKEA